MRHFLALGVLLLTLAGSKSTKADYSPEVKSALKKVAFEDDCEGSSLNVVVTLSKCSKLHEYEWFIREVTSYANKCLTPTYVAGKIRSAMAGWSTNVLESFMDETFIARYRADNPHDPPIHFEARKDRYCCQPKYAYNAIIKSIKPHKGMGLIKDREFLKSYLTSHLFEPCQNYYNRTVDVMFQLHVASPYMDGGLEAFVNEMPENENAIFRFIMCNYLQYERWQKKVVKDIASKMGL